MSREYRETEAAIHTMIADIAGELDRVAPPNEAVLARVKTAVRHEMNEQWLAQQSGPEPSGEAMARLRRAVRQALVGTTKSGPPDSLRVQWRAALTAAAMIALCLGLIRHVGHLQAERDHTLVLAAAREHVDFFVDAAQESLAPDEFSQSVLNELEFINGRLAGSDDDSVGSELDEADHAIQDIIEDSEQNDGKVGSGSWSSNDIG